MTRTVLDHLIDLIVQDGPQPISGLMELALAHPAEGYYSAQASLGAGGDFITAPEISQMFGEILGAFAHETWTDLGEPELWQVIELGPGTGRLASDLIRTLSKRPQAIASAQFRLVEISSHLERQQRELLGTQNPITWHRSLETVPDAPFILIANEFFDTLPVRQFLKRGRTWCEKRVALAGDRLQFTVAPTAFDVEAEAPTATPAPDGAVIEISGAARAQARVLGERLTRVPGRALLIDYGYADEPHGDTLQALARHTKVPVLENLGRTDLTAHVDFAALAREATKAGARAFGPIAQGDFLQRLGIEARRAALAAKAAPEVRERLARQLHRLTAPEAMGSLFKVLALSSPGLPPPPGFEPADD